MQNTLARIEAVDNLNVCVGQREIEHIHILLDAFLAHRFRYRHGANIKLECQIGCEKNGFRLNVMSSLVLCGVLYGVLDEICKKIV